MARADKILAATGNALAGRKLRDVNAFELALAVHVAVPDASPDEISAVIGFSARQIFRDAIAHLDAKTG